jgi:DNA-binding PadR family transcriptional regulator
MTDANTWPHPPFAGWQLDRHALRHLMRETRHGGHRGGPSSGPRGFGPGRGFPFGGFDFGGGRRAGRGDIRAAILALLNEEPMHGYQIMQELESRTGGAWRVSPGSVYPTLQQLEDEGLVRAQEQEGRRVYRLTDDGQRVAADRAEEFATLWEGIAPSEDDTQLGDLIFQVGAAFVQVARTGTAEQMAEARKVLARTRGDLYRILGDRDADAERSKRS